MKKSLLIGTIVALLLLVGCTKASESDVSEQVQASEGEISSSDIEVIELLEVKDIENGSEESGDLNSLTEEEVVSDFIVSETDTNITYVNPFGIETTVSKSPEKVVILFNSILDLWYANGGEAVARVKGSTNVPEAATDLIDLGSAYSVSLESIVALEPSLVVLASNVDHQVSLADKLVDMGIETMLVDTSYLAYERFKENALLFGRINAGKVDYETSIVPVIGKVDTLIENASELEGPTVAALFASSKRISIDTELALTGEMIDLLGGENIVTSKDLVAEGETRIPYSIEALLAKDPDMIFIATMGDIEGVKEAIDEMIEGNPAWLELSAVKSDQVYYLPKEYSVYKPNARYDEAFHYIYDLMYQEDK